MEGIVFFVLEEFCSVCVLGISALVGSGIASNGLDSSKEHKKQKKIKNEFDFGKLKIIFDTIYMMELSGFDKSKTIIVYGRTISRLYDERVSQKLVLRGHNNTMILKGGFSAWRKKGYPLKS